MGPGVGHCALAVTNSAPAPQDVLYAALITDGTLSAMAQRAAAAHAKARGPQGVLQPLALALLTEGLRDKRFPPQAGMRTAELEAVVGAAAFKAVHAYHSRGGVLLAKDYLSASSVVAAIIAAYWRGFSAPVPTALKPRAAEAEIRARAAVASQEVAAVLRAWRQKPAPRGIAYDDAIEEAISAAVARAALRGFLHPNESLHEALHGGDSNDA